MPAPRIVAVDHGSRRVGVAVSDPLRMFAQPHGTFGLEEAIAELKRLAAGEGIEAIVLGWPLTPEGAEGEAVRRVTPFRNRLRKLFPGVPVIEWDERGSSRRAVAAMVEAGTKRSSRGAGGRVDRAAAAIILQEYLDEHAGDQADAHHP